ncbi:hypothetical protein Back11_33570 [Paenibacillus baekrokdamisoli]|uniref:Uncharacterized protein n=1 Tax=Paenibacillus baekrokdamisoli TaxID=1712516 RepID=A0A3G9IUQ2_9BACL|nr:hypothetical protein [Paenibacillus baekrokdamisoli]MBB3072936.1 hypothetical protein [Paenibacillus baekrokdamisoli]BBH22012.1 hypothetical protein Back11_33570 [Paenibacillus baekrokdamisoli]
MNNVANEEKYLQLREQQSFYFQEHFKSDKTETYISPSLKFTLTVEHFYYSEGIVGKNYTRGTVTNNVDESKIIIDRNYSHFLFKWVTQGEHEYLLCGQDYQGYTMVDLSNNEIIDFVPEEAYEGDGFCWAAIYNYNTHNILVVEGCFWAAEYEIVFYDFSEPLKLPYKEIMRITPYEKVVGWAEAGYFEYLDENLNLIKAKVL